MFAEFKDFIAKGNVLDLAVAVIIGAAFGTIVSSLTGDVIMPLIGAVVGDVDFATVVINFLILAFVIFLLVRYANKVMKKAEAAPAGPSEVDLLTEIRDELKKRG
jgi:large conductance mechanosensitive channel